MKSITNLFNILAELILTLLEIIPVFGALIGGVMTFWGYRCRLITYEDLTASSWKPYDGPSVEVIRAEGVVIFEAGAVLLISSLLLIIAICLFKMTPYGSKNNNIAKQINEIKLPNEWKLPQKLSNLSKVVSSEKEPNFNNYICDVCGTKNATKSQHCKNCGNLLNL